MEINPHWAGFTKDDYFNAIAEISDDDGELCTPSVSVADVPTQFDLSGFEIARGCFFQSPEDLSVTLTASNISFAKACVLKLGKTDTVELLFDPLRKLLAVRPASSSNKHSIQWASSIDGNRHTRSICGTAFLPVLYEMLSWDTGIRYRVHGTHRQKGNEVVLFFDMSDAEKYIETAILPPTENNPGRAAVFDEGVRPLAKTFKTTVVASPASWSQNFGRKVSGGTIPIIEDDAMPWNVAAVGVPYQIDKALNPSPEATLQQGIREIVETIQVRISRAGSDTIYCGFDMGRRSCFIVRNHTKGHCQTCRLLW